MKILIQRVAQAQVNVEDQSVGAIGKGYLLLVGIEESDSPDMLEPMASKVARMRLFPAPSGDSHFDLALADVDGQVLAVSQFTLCANCRKGRRPSFSQAARPEGAQELFDRFVEHLRAHVPRVETGRFGASMQVALVNDGPVTIYLDSREVLPAMSR